MSLVCSHPKAHAHGCCMWFKATDRHACWQLHLIVRSFSSGKRFLLLSDFEYPNSHYGSPIFDEHLYVYQNASFLLDHQDLITWWLQVPSAHPAGNHNPGTYLGSRCSIICKIQLWMKTIIPLDFSKNNVASSSSAVKSRQKVCFHPIQES